MPTNHIGLCSIQVNRASGLPYWKAVTRLSFDMDPFVIISFGQKIFRTRVIRHSMDPVWDENLFFHVQKHEASYSILFNMFDWDKMSSNDYIGESELLLEHLIEQADQSMRLDPETGLYQLDPSGKLIGDHMISYELPIVHTPTSRVPPSAPIKDLPTAQEPIEVTYNGKLSIKAKFTPYSAMRQVFWWKYLEEFDTDGSRTISSTELSSMLDSLGSTLTHETISGFFSRFKKSSDLDQDTLSFQQVISCLESELLKPLHDRHQIEDEDEAVGVGQTAINPSSQPLSTVHVTQDPAGGHPSVSFPEPSSSPTDSIQFIGHNSIDVTKTPTPPSISLSNSPGSSTPLEEVGEQPPSSSNLIRSLSSLSVSSSSSCSSSYLRFEKVVNITCCPICHQEQTNLQDELDMVTHMAVCASQDWTSLQNILSPGNFVTSSQANRKWFTKMIGKVQNGRYSLGANSANIIVQDRRTGKLIEEKMQAYVRLGIRLMYKSGGSNADRMEHQRMKKLLKSLTIKQGSKFDAPESIKEIMPFVNFHDLDLNEIKLPLREFRNFNEFFYRELKPNSRPIEGPGDPSILTSLADCRLMVFKDLVQSKLIWIKGRRFSLEKLLGNLGKRNIPNLNSPTTTTPSQGSPVIERLSITNEDIHIHHANDHPIHLDGSEIEMDRSFSSSRPVDTSTSVNQEGAQELRWSLGIFRLAPQDYHRFHSPVDGTIVDIEFIEGQYYTVNPMAIRSTIDVYGENVRVVICIETERFDKIFCVFVGAMMVGSVKMNVELGDRVKKGNDIGYFAFGGSTILTIVGSDKIEWDQDLQTNSNHCLETLVRVGTRVGKSV